MISKIIAVASAIPKEKINVLDLGFDEYTTERTMKLTGVKSVRYAPADKTALDYCLEAAKSIIKELDVDVASIDGIIFATPHSDYVYPGNTSIIQSELGISSKCIAMDVNHSCTGMIYGLYTADLLIRSGDCKNVLVCCGDTASHHLNKKDRALRMVVGDGGAVALVSVGGKSKAEYAFCHDGSGLKYLYTPAGGERIPICPGKTDVEYADAEENIRSQEDELMDGMEVMRFVMYEVPELINSVLEKKKWTKDDVSVYAMHQANAFMLKSLTRNMKLDKKKVILDIDGNGNIGGASLMLALCHAVADKNIELEKAILVGFGAGLSGAAIATDLSETIFLPVIEM